MKDTLLEFAILEDAPDACGSDACAGDFLTLFLSPSSEFKKKGKKCCKKYKKKGKKKFCSDCPKL